MNPTRFRFACMGAATAIAAPLPPAHGAPVMDQFSPYINAGMIADGHWQQEVVVGRAGHLLRIDIPVNRDGTDYGLTLNLGAGWQHDDNDFEVIGQVASGGILSVDLSPANLMFAVGDRFMLSLSSRTGDWLGSNADPAGAYAPGVLWRFGAVYDSGRWDAGFTTYVEAGVAHGVPVPGTLLLSGAGLLALVRRRSMR